MEIKRLTEKDAKKFSDLIIDMYGHLECLDWFSPMPFDLENIKQMISHPRFYIIGVFDGDNLCAVSSFDYKCGKLIGKIDFPKECNTDKLVEIGFTMVHSKYRGNGLMKKMVAYLVEEAKKQGFEWIFGKVHVDNLASSKSFLNNGFYKCLRFMKPTKVEDIKMLLNGKVLSEQAKVKITKRLEENIDAENLDNEYEIIIKKI